MLRRTFFASAAWLAGAPALAQTADPRFTLAALYSAQRGGVGLLVVRHGVVLFEHYPANTNARARWPLGEGSRLYAALLVGALADDRLLRLDEPVSRALNEWALDEARATMSLRMLMQGVGAVSFGAGDPQDAAHALALTPAAAPGLSFSSNAAPFVLLSEIARRKLEASARTPDPGAYLMNRVLAPIGAAGVQWARGPDGAARFDGGAAADVRSWALAGELFRREGVWRAQQIIDASVAREALHGSFAEPRAGIGLWLRARGAARSDAPASLDSDLWRAPADFEVAMAAGAGGQRLYILPERHLVIARLSRASRTRDWSDATFLGHVLREL